MSCPTCGFAHATTQADCPLCLRTESQRCPDCDAAISAQANFCSRCGRALGRVSSPDLGVRDDARDAHDDRSVRAPAWLMDSVLASRAALEGERKQVTVLFADVRGSLSVIQGADPEEGQALLDAVIDAMTDAVHRYEGAVNQVMGDGIMALFGAPVAHEDHALRAACAALAMQDAVRRLRNPNWDARGVRPEIRVGLHSGDVVIRSVRNDLSMEYRAVGSTVHLASRMEQLATPGTVWLTEQTLQLGRGLLRTRPLGPTRVKGVDEPICVHELTGISVRTRFQANALRGLSPLVGRQDIVNQLLDALAHAARGESRAVILWGDPGVGKSRLCHEVLQRSADRFRVLEAAAVSYTSSTPHRVLASMARSLFGIDDDDDLQRVTSKARACLQEFGEALANQLHVALELLDVPSRDRDWMRLDPVQKRRRIEEFLRALLSAWCARGPAVLLCEDLHWCDAESLAFISSLLHAPPGANTLLLFTHRPQMQPLWAEQPHIASLRVPELDARQSEALLCSLLGADGGLAALRTRLVARTDGNPFFIEESARSIVESGALRESGAQSAERVELPASIEALLGARLDRLPDAALELVQAAAVLGDDSPTDLLRVAVDVDRREFGARLSALTRAELLYETTPSVRDETQVAGSTLRFKHGLIQEIVYKRMMRPRKRALHARMLELLERQYSERPLEFVERLAEHAYHAELWDKSAHYHTQACVRAASRSANTQATLHLERGIEVLTHWPDTPARARAAIDLRLTALAALLPMGAHERAIELLREAEQHAIALDDKARLAKVSSQLSVELWLTARYDLAQRAARQCLQLSEELAGDQFALVSAARYNLAMTLHARGEFDAALSILRELVRVFSGETGRRRLGWAGYPSVMSRTFIISVASMTGDFAEAERTFLEGRALADELDHPFSRTMILEQYGLCMLVKGEPDAAERVLRDAMAVCLQDEVRTMYTPIASHLGLALLELGALEEGRSLLEQTAAGATDLAGRYAIDYLAIGLAEAQLRTGDVVLAVETTERAVEETDKLGERGFNVRARLHHAAALLALCACAPDPEALRHAALSECQRALNQAEQLGMPPWRALVYECQAAVHESFAAGRDSEAHYAQARRSLQSALEIWQGLRAAGRVERLVARLARLPM